MLEDQHPQQIVSDMKKSLRTGKVFVDWSQNDDHKTTVCVYSLRAKERPTVSTPVTWDEVGSCLKKRDPQMLTFVSEQVLERVSEMGDLFEPVLKLKQRLPKPKEMPAELAEQYEHFAPKITTRTKTKPPAKSDVKSKTKAKPVATKSR
jgi:bifunctional non-homologous end joining protein LigD